MVSLASKLANGDRLVTKYMHMIRAPKVSVGEKVHAGQIIGNVGSTGRSSGPHLHFETWVNGKVVDPNSYLRGKKVSLAQGGYVDPVPGGVRALIAEAGRTERVEPLDSRGLSRRDRDIVDRLDLLLATMSGRGDGKAAPEIRVFIGDQELRGVVRTEIGESNRKMARKLSQGRRHHI
jgi:hypothetical protein